MSRHFSIALVVFFAVSTSEVTAQAVSREAGAALARMLPEGYQTAAVISCTLEGNRTDRFVAVLVDNTTAELHDRVARLLYLSWTGRWKILDSFEIAGIEPNLSPQYLGGIAVVKIGSANLLFVHTAWTAGGSGAIHYFQFFEVVGDRLGLVRQFEHDRMKRGLLCLRNDRIYDAAVACSRGDKVGKAYVYSCYLDTTEFTYDGTQILPVRKERLEERTGNRFLEDSYRNLSLRSILLRGGHFSSQP